jgi:hypothetical protein
MLELIHLIVILRAQIGAREALSNYWSPSADFVVGQRTTSTIRKLNP